MNLMYPVLLKEEFNCKNKKLNERVRQLKEKLAKNKFKFEEKGVKIGNTEYFHNVLPYIPSARDVLKKPDGVCKIRVNWKKKNFEGMTPSEIFDQLKPQYGWSIEIVDAEHSRNKFKNRSIAWVVFDKEEDAKKYMSCFNSLFITAIEQDAINEYKKFRENPEKRPLTFDKIIDNAYELYEQVDKGEI